MIGYDIVDPFYVMGFYAHGGKHEAMCEKTGEGVSLWV